MMDSLLRKSGRSWRAARAQATTLILISATIQISHFILLDLINTDKRILLHSRKSILQHNFRPFYTLFTDFLIEEIKLIDSNSKFPQLFISLSHFIGCSNGLFFVWWFGKRVSPRFCLLLACFGQIFLNLLSAFIPFYWTFVVFRYLNGLAIGACLRSIYCLINDWSTNKLIGWFLVHILGARFLATGIGCFLLYAPKSQAINPWRLLLLVQAMLLSVLSFVALICVRESPRWLLKTGRSSDFVAIGRQFSRDLDMPVIDDREFYKDQDRLIRLKNGVTKFQQLQLAICFAISTAITLKMQSTRSAKPVEYDFLLLLGAQLTAYILCTILEQKAARVHVGFAVLALVVNVIFALAPESNAQIGLIQATRFLCFLHSDLLFLAIFNSGPFDQMPNKPQLSNFRIRLATCAQALAFLIGRPVGVLFALDFVPVNKFFNLKVAHAESGLVCATGYLIIIVLQLLATCIRESSSFEGVKRSTKGPVVIIEDEAYFGLDNDHLDFECCPQIEDKSSISLLRPTSLIAELKHNRQFLRQRSANEVEVEVDSDGVDIEI
ncbi:Organic cation transporter protein-like protein [Aphelenchoides bicaudatus]|nr:Organic cation transporter protein-like protein [Aphelenchoides bicaudatus]